MRGRLVVGALGTLSVFATGACRKAPAPSESTQEPNAEPLDSRPATPRIAAEILPRCHVEGARVGLLGEDIVVGESAVSTDGLAVGLIRRDGEKVVASVVLTSFDLARPSYVDLGPALGDDPPPVPFATARGILVAHHGRRAGERAGFRDAGAGSPLRDAAGRRDVRIVRLDGGKPVEIGPAITQQADESQAFDLALGEGSAAPLVAWDEDAPLGQGRMLADRGLIKVQLVGGGPAAVVSPPGSDAEGPRLVARPGGFVLAWIAKKSAEVDAGAAMEAAKARTSEGPGEGRTYRWIEWVALDAKGAPTTPVRRLAGTGEHGHVAAFDLRVVEGGRVVAIVQDEAAVSEGGGARIQRLPVDADQAPGALLVDAGVGTTLAGVVPHVDAARPWLAFADTDERTRLVPLTPTLVAGAGATLEPALDGARVLGANGDRVVAVSSLRSTSISDGNAREGRPELVRLVCR